MADKSTTQLELLITAQARQFEQEMNKVQASLNKLGAAKKQTEGLGAGFKSAMPDVSKFALASGAAGLAITALTVSFDNMVKKEKSLAEFSAITGVTGQKLQEFGDMAADMSLKFGGSTVDNIETFKGVLSRLGPGFASSTDAVRLMGENINTLAIAAGLDATGAMDALTTAMLQFGVDTSDPIAAAEMSTKMMDVMAAAAQEGAAEIPQIAEALKQVGVTAKGLNISFIETNAAIQTLALAGKTGSEAGVALRNVISSLTSATGPGESALASMGLSVKDLSKSLTSGDPTALNNTLNQLRAGLEKLPDPGARAAAMAALFGKENMAAAGALIANTEATNDFTTALDKNGVAASQAATIMNTVDGRWRQTIAFLENTGVRVLESAKEILQGIVGAATAAYDGLKSLVTLDFDGFSQAGVNLARGVGDLYKGSTFGLIDVNDWFGLNAKEAEKISDETTKKVAENTKKLVGEVDKVAASTVRTPAMVKAEIDKLTEEYNNTANGKLIPQIKKLKAEYDKLMDPLSAKKGGKKKAESPIAGSVGALEADLRKIQDAMQNRLTIGSDAFLIAANKARILEERLKALKRAAGETDFEVKAMTLSFKELTAPENLKVYELNNAAVAMQDIGASSGTAYGYVDNLVPVFGTLGDALSSSLTGGADAMKAGLKAVLSSIIDFLNAEYIAAGAAVALRALISGSLSLFADSAGWAAASIALQLAKGAINSFAVGSDYITKDQLALVHKGEMIIPRTFAEGVRSGDLAVTGNQEKRETYKRRGDERRKIIVRQDVTPFRNNVEAVEVDRSRWVMA